MADEIVSFIYLYDRIDLKSELSLFIGDKATLCTYLVLNCKFLYLFTDRIDLKSELPLFIGDKAFLCTYFVLMWGFFIDPTVKTARTARGSRSRNNSSSSSQLFVYLQISRSAGAGALYCLVAHDWIVAISHHTSRFWAIYRRHRYSWKKAVRYGTTSL
jgi:hypothetical protein